MGRWQTAAYRYSVHHRPDSPFVIREQFIPRCVNLLGARLPAYFYWIVMPATSTLGQVNTTFVEYCKPWTLSGQVINSSRLVRRAFAEHVNSCSATCNYLTHPCTAQTEILYQTRSLLLHVVATLKEIQASCVSGGGWDVDNTPIITSLEAYSETYVESSGADHTVPRGTGCQRLGCLGSPQQELPFRLPEWHSIDRYGIW